MHESILSIKMLLRRNLLVIICGVIIASEAVSGTEEKKVWGALGDEVSFGPDKPLPASVSSITWKHVKGVGDTVKAIEWEDGLTETPNPRFKGITTLNTTTGQITIKELTDEHSGVYTIDISGKEQAQRFTLTLIEPVPQPEIKVEQSDDPGVVYLRCEYSEKIIWRNSAGQTLTGSKINPKGESITVKKNGNPDDYYTCTLENKAGSKTSERVYERDLFKAESAGSNAGLIAGLIIGIALIVVIAVLFPVLYKHKCFPHDWGKNPYIGGWLNCLDRKKKVKHDEEKPDENKHDDGKPDENKHDDGKPDENKPDDGKPDENKPDEEKPDEEKPDENKPDDGKPDEEKPDENKPDAKEQDEDSDNPAQPMLNSGEKNDRGKNNHTQL